jgi:hypothetical protein
MLVFGVVIVFLGEDAVRTRSFVLCGVVFVYSVVLLFGILTMLQMLQADF